MIQGEKCSDMRGRYVKSEFIMRNYAEIIDRRLRARR